MTGLRVPRLLAPVVSLARSAGAHRVPNLAAETAFFVALAMFPMLLTVVAVLRAIAPLTGGGEDLAVAVGTTRMLEVVLGQIDPTTATAAGALLIESEPAVLGVGTVAALVLAVRALRSVFYALAVIADRRPRRWPAALSLAVALVGGGASVIALTVSNPLTLVGMPRVVWDVLRWPALVAALLAWNALLLRTGMRIRGRVSRRPLLLGAAVATAGWILASALLPLYVAVASAFTPTLGALGGALAVLVWLYLLVLALYVAAEVVTVSRVGPSPDTRPEPGTGPEPGHDAPALGATGRPGAPSGSAPRPVAG